MILDNLAILSDSQAITASAVSTNVYDLGAAGKTAYQAVQLKRNMGKAHPIPLLIQVVADFATLTSLTVAIQHSDDNATFADVMSVVVPVAQLKKGLILPIDKLPRGITKRYVRLNYTVTGSNATAGAITAGFVGSVDGAYVG